MRRARSVTACQPCAVRVDTDRQTAEHRHNVRDAMSRYRRLTAALTVLACLLAGGAWASGVRTDVIVHPTVEGKKINSTTLRNIYLLRQTQWPGGQPVVVFVLRDSNPVHESFAKETLGLYPYRLRQTWDRLSFSGMARPPLEVGDENEMRARVRSTPGAIGYITKDTGNESIKTLRVE